MEFLNKMKKSEFIQMALKLLISLLLGIIVIFFMEAMIYNIVFKEIEKNGNYSQSSSVTDVYYIAEQDDGKYMVYIDANGWATITVSRAITEAELNVMLEEGGKMHGEIVRYRQPNIFDIGIINGFHITVMIIFLGAIVGVFVWRFMLINKEYQKLERKFKKTGKIFA